MNKQNRNQLTDTENKLVVAREGEDELGGLGFLFVSKIR